MKQARNLAKSLLTYINNHVQEDTYFDLCTIILQNIHQVPELPITQLAELCYVSPSTITRFCRYFQCKNYIDFKNNIASSTKHIEHSVFHINKDMYHKLLHEPSTFMSAYADEISQAVHDVSQHINYEQIERLVGDLHEHERVYLFGYSTSLAFIETFQTDLLFANKITYCGYHEEKQKDLAKNVQKEDLILIFSSYGNYMSEASDILDTLLESHARLILITQNPHVTNQTMFDEIVYLTSKSYGQSGSYPLFMGMEYIVRRYTARYYHQTKEV